MTIVNTAVRYVKNRLDIKSSQKRKEKFLRE